MMIMVKLKENLDLKKHLQGELEKVNDAKKEKNIK